MIPKVTPVMSVAVVTKHIMIYNLFYSKTVHLLWINRSIFLVYKTIKYFNLMKTYSKNIGVVFTLTSLTCL